MVYHLFREMIAIIHNLHTERRIRERGVVAEHDLRQRVRSSLRPEGEAAAREDIGWYMLVYNVQQAASHGPVGIIQAEAARQLLRTIDLDMRGGGIRMIRNAVPWSLNNYSLTLLETDHPLSLCKVLLQHRSKNQLSAVAEVRRNDGHLAFQACSFSCVSAPFEALMLESAYSYLRDLVSLSIFQSVSDGMLNERSVQPIQTEDVPVAEEAPDPSPVPVMEPEVRDLPTEAEINRVRVGRSRLSYRHIIATLLRFGVRIDPGGRHLKLRLGDATSPFLNPHRQQNPDHNRRVLREALARLGINEDDFMTALNG